MHRLYFCISHMALHVCISHMALYFCICHMALYVCISHLAFSNDQSSKKIKLTPWNTFWGQSHRLYTTTVNIDVLSVYTQEAWAYLRVELTS